MTDDTIVCRRRSDDIHVYDDTMIYTVVASDSSMLLVTMV
jgi:hypothetical protein